MRTDYGVKQVPEALLTLFGVIILVLMGMNSISILLTIPFSITVLAGLHLFFPKPPTTLYGLIIGYVVGAVLAGLLILAAAIAPISGTQESVEAFHRIVFPLIGLYVIAVLSLGVKLR